MLIGKPKCVFCKEKKGFLHSVHEYGCYGDIERRIYYHPECLELIETEPEKFAHTFMDMAIFILEQKKTCIYNTNKYIKKNFYKKVEELNKQHFENMMPKKT